MTSAWHLVRRRDVQGDETDAKSAFVRSAVEAVVTRCLEQTRFAAMSGGRPSGEERSRSFFREASPATGCRH